MTWPDAGDELREGLDESQLGRPETWFYCLRHHRVEQGHQCPARFLLGPFATAEEASHALEKVQDNNEAWDAQERVDHSHGDKDRDGDEGGAP